MSLLDTCVQAIESCGRAPDDIEACLEILRPILEPYYEEGGFDKRFATSFRTTMRLPMPHVRLGQKKIVEGLLAGPTYADQQAKVQAAREAQLTAYRAQIKAEEKAFISTLLAKLGLRQGDELIVLREGQQEHISLRDWDLPTVDEALDAAFKDDEDKEAKDK